MKTPHIDPARLLAARIDQSFADDTRERDSASRIESARSGLTFLGGLIGDVLANAGDLFDEKRSISPEEVARLGVLTRSYVEAHDRKSLALALVDVEQLGEFIEGLLPLLGGHYTQRVLAELARVDTQPERTS